jgi:hypothetical protein
MEQRVLVKRGVYSCGCSFERLTHDFPKKCPVCEHTGNFYLTRILEYEAIRDVVDNAITQIFRKNKMLSGKDK